MNFVMILMIFMMIFEDFGRFLLIFLKRWEGKKKKIKSWKLKIFPPKKIGKKTPNFSFFFFFFCFFCWTRRKTKRYLISWHPLFYILFLVCKNEEQTNMFYNDQEQMPWRKKKKKLKEKLFFLWYDYSNSNSTHVRPVSSGDFNSTLILLVLPKNYVYFWLYFWYIWFSKLENYEQRNTVSGSFVWKKFLKMKTFSLIDSNHLHFNEKIQNKQYKIRKQ